MAHNVAATPMHQNSAGRLVPDYREAAKRMIREAGVDPDAPLNVDWDRTPDRRMVFDAEEEGRKILAKRNGA